MINKRVYYSPLFKRILMGSTMLFLTTGIAFAEQRSVAPEITSTTQSDQQKQITGTVLDHTGEAIIGASVTVKGATIGTVTDLDGQFTLNVPSNGTLVITYIGYLPQEVKIGSQSQINITLREDSQALDEVVVVGYGVQKKVNLTGSVANIKMDEMLESRPISNISQGLAGLAAGVQVTSGSNRPGENNASITIRGQGTLNNSAPLVIIDGVEGDLGSVNPQDIEDLSVLKDAASASIYGSRAANGVILITTKKGKVGSVKVDYNGYVSWETISNKFDMVSNYADYMELVNEGLSNSKMATVFTNDRIDEWRAGKDPLKYPNTNLMDAMFQTSVGTNQNISVSGGSDKIKFYTSFGYLDSPGIMENVGYKRYSMRTNVEANIKPWLTLGANLSGYLGQTESGSLIADRDDTSSIFTFAAGTTPGMVFKSPDGRYGAMNNSQDDAQAANNNPLWRLNYNDGINESRDLKTRFYGTLSPIKGLTLTGSFNYSFTDQIKDQKPLNIPQWDFLSESITKPNQSKTSIRNSDYKWNDYLMDAVATYTNNVSKLNYSVMVGASQELYRYKWFQASKVDLVDPELGAINGATGAASASGNTVEWAMQSYFGRINLNWDDKYLFEANIRADGSSRFNKDDRWGYFPSMSAAWRIDQESFMQDLTDTWLTNLKLRVSYGELGNNALSSKNANIENNYLAQALYSNRYKIGTGSTEFNNNYPFNNMLSMGVAQTGISNKFLTWERTKVTGVGIDFGVLNNKLTGTLDYFHKKTEKILIDIPIPLVNGNANAPRQNAGTVVNKGFEISLAWQDKIQDVSYFISPNVTFLNNKITKFKGDVMALENANMKLEGYAINTQYGYVVDRLVQTQADLDYVQNFVDNSDSKTPFASVTRPAQGDLMYKDLNNDGVINDKDRTIIGHGPTPKFTFGVNLGAAYKGFDFSMLIQGSTGMEQYLLDNYYRPQVRYGYQISQQIADGRWYEGRTDATYPRLLNFNDNRNTIVSDYWIQKKSYVKIKNIQLGYALPKSLVSRLSIDRIRVYGSLENFFTFTNYDGLDPEVGGFAYPTSKQAVIGLNVTF